MARPPQDESPNIPRTFRKHLLEQMKGQEILDSEELSLFEWYVSEHDTTISNRMDIERIKELITQRERIDEQLVALVTAGKKERKPQSCSLCGSDSHTARTCPQKDSPIPAAR